MHKLLNVALLHVRSQHSNADPCQAKQQCDIVPYTVQMARSHRKLPAGVALAMSGHDDATRFGPVFWECPVFSAARHSRCKLEMEG